MIINGMDFDNDPHWYGFLYPADWGTWTMGAGRGTATTCTWDFGATGSTNWLAAAVAVNAA